MKKFGYTNLMAVPRLKKIVVNMGVGKATENKKRMEDAVRDLGDHHRPEAARHPRQEVRVGLQAARRRRDRLQGHAARPADVRVPRPADQPGHAAYPRLPRLLARTAFDGRGNYTLGLAEQTVFPEINIDKVEFTQGMDITFVISGGNDDASRELLRLLGFPFRREEAKSKGTRMTRTCLMNKTLNHAEVRRAAPQSLHAVRPPARRTTGSSRSAGSASASWPPRASIPGVRKAVGKRSCGLDARMRTNIR